MGKNSTLNKEDHINRVLAMMTEIEINSIETGKFADSPDKKNKIANAAQSLKSTKLFYKTIAGKPFEDQLSIMRRWLVKEVGLNEDGTAKNPLDFTDEEFNKNLLKTIDELELSVRSYNCLKYENIIYVGDLVSKSEAEMLKTANFGRKSLNELKENLKAMGLGFGMKLVNWPPKNMDELLKLKNKEF